MFITYKQLNHAKVKKEELDLQLLDALIARNPIIEKNEEVECANLTKTRSVSYEVAFNSFIKYFDIELLSQMPEIKMDPDTALYRTFRIPKKSNPKKFRVISEPVPELKSQQREFAQFMENKMYVLPHSAAHAYVKERSNVTAVKVHQDNASKWSLKLDLSNFFPSYDLTSIVYALKQVYPFGVIYENPQYTHIADRITKNLSYCVHNGHLPQGTPISPYLTNIMMVPIDHMISSSLRDFDKKNFVYTRYADDIEISCKQKFDPDVIIKIVSDIFQICHVPFKINREKTKFVSYKGKNWSLGIMRNGQNEITVGHKQNQRIRAGIFNFMREPDTFSVSDVQKLMGLISYYTAVEPDYMKYVLKKYGYKFNKDVLKTMRDKLK